MVLLLACSFSVLATKTVYSYTGVNQTYVVPAGITQITVKVWGAGGGAADIDTNVGGSGGFTNATISVTPLETLNIVVSGGGDLGTSGGTGGFGGGGTGGTGGGITGGGGGGRSAIYRGNDDLVVAGGGGGAVTAANCPSCYGGSGGGLNGSGGMAYEGAVNINYGNQTSGGTEITGYAYGTPGSKNLGGTGGGGSWRGGGGGGAGYYGGGGGGGEGVGNAVGGGGGSGYIDGFGVSAATTTTGINETPPRTSDVDHQIRIGYGGNSSNATGGNGLIIIMDTNETSPAPVPEFSTFAILAALGIVLAGVLMRRRA